MPPKRSDENSLKRYLTAEVKYIIGVMAFVRGIAVPYFGIKQDIEIIRHNHMAHIESFSKDLAKLSEIQTEQQKMLIDLMKEISKK